MRFKNKKVLITGASGQLGKQFCYEFAERGAEVYVSDIDIDKCTSIINNLPNKHLHKELYLDVQSPKSVKNAFNEIKHKSKTIDIIINNAGIAVFSPFEERNFEDFMKVFRVNTGGAFLCIKEGSKLMREEETKGSIVNIGSIYGMVSGDPSIYTDCARNTSECYGAQKPL